MKNLKTPILFNYLWSVRKSTFFWSLALVSSTILVIALYGSMASQIGEAFSGPGSPDGFEAFFGDTGSFSTPAGWLGLEMFSLMLPMSLAIIGIGAGASAIGREENSGTLELLLSSPISRGRILIEKFAGIAAQLAIVCLATWIAIVAGKDGFDFDIGLKNAALATLSAFLVGLFFAAAALAIQAFTGKRSLAIGICSGLLILFYFIDSLAPLVDSIENLKYLSIFHYYEGQEALTNGLTTTNTLVLAGTSLALSVASHFGFRKRDTGV